MELTQKLVSSRKGSLYVSIAAAVLAGIVILAYVNGYRNNLKAGTTPVTVLVARHTIDKGTAGGVIATKDLFTATTIRESQLREGAFSDPASLSGKVATKTIFTQLHVIRVGTLTSSSGSTASSLTLVVTQCQAEVITWFLTYASLKYTLESYHDYAPGDQAPDPKCPTVGDAKGVNLAVIKAAFPGLF